MIWSGIKWIMIIALGISIGFGINKLRENPIYMESFLIGFSIGIIAGAR